jgi:SAM-dependent methyltransferase
LQRIQIADSPFDQPGYPRNMAGRWMTIKYWASTARAQLRSDGLWSVLAAALRTVKALGVNLLQLPGEIMFEFRTQTRTRGDYWPSQKVIANARYGDGYHYKPIDRRLMNEALRTVEIDPQASTFVDLGCGKGRALVVAAELGWRRLVGVEYDPKLAARAQENAESYSRRKQSSPDLSIEIIEGDAANYEPPAGQFVLFMYNPFGEETVAAVIDRVVQSWRSDRRPVAVVYAFPRWEHQLRNRELVETARVGSRRHPIDQVVIWRLG